MELIIRLVLMFVFIQFLVVMTIMTVALLLARPEVPLLGCEPGHEAIRRSYECLIHLPLRTIRSVGRWVHSMRLLRSAH